MPARRMKRVEWWHILADRLARSFAAAGGSSRRDGRVSVRQDDRAAEPHPFAPDEIVAGRRVRPFRPPHPLHERSPPTTSGRRHGAKEIIGLRRTTSPRAHRTTPPEFDDRRPAYLRSRHARRVSVAARRLLAAFTSISVLPSPAVTEVEQAEGWSSVTPGAPLPLGRAAGSGRELCLRGTDGALRPDARKRRHESDGPRQSSGRAVGLNGSMLPCTAQRESAVNQCLVDGVRLLKFSAVANARAEWLLLDPARRLPAAGEPSHAQRRMALFHVKH